LKSFAKLLIKLADLKSRYLVTLPIGAREHVHLQPDFNISKSSAQVIVGRIDAKGTGDFYDRYQQKAHN
jgi:hypothetical protein